MMVGSFGKGHGIGKDSMIGRASYYEEQKQSQHGWRTLGERLSDVRWG